jgi:hypothetical protein
MKNILLILSVCFSVLNYGQYNSVKINAKKETNTYCLKNILTAKDDSFFDQTLISPNPIKRRVSIKNAVLDKITVYDTLGQLQKSVVFLNNSEYHTIDLSE